MKNIITYLIIIISFGGGCISIKNTNGPNRYRCNIISDFAKLEASDPSYMDMLKSKDRVEITECSILFKGDGSVSSMVVVLDEAGRIRACQHVELDIPNDGYYKLVSESWRRCESNEWEEMLAFHHKYKREFGLRIDNNFQ